MTSTPYFTQRRQRLTALVAAFVLFAGQLLIAQHVHAAELPDSACVVCVQGDHTPVADSLVEPAASHFVAVWEAVQLTPSVIARVNPAYLARAPPLS